MVDPAVVEVEGPSSQVARIESAGTEDVDAGRLLKGKEYRKTLLLPSDKVTVIREEPVTVKLIPRKKKR